MQKSVEFLKAGAEIYVKADELSRHESLNDSGIDTKIVRRPVCINPLTPVFGRPSVSFFRGLVRRGRPST